LDMSAASYVTLLDEEDVMLSRNISLLYDALPVEEQTPPKLYIFKSEAGLDMFPGNVIDIDRKLVPEIPLLIVPV
jgi:hypothetical protein